MLNQTEEIEFSFKKIIVAVDGSPNSSRAAGIPIRLSKGYSAKLMVSHVLSRACLGFRKLLTGSVTSGVVAHFTCAVLVVR